MRSERFMIYDLWYTGVVSSSVLVPDSLYAPLKSTLTIRVPLSSPLSLEGRGGEGIQRLLPLHAGVCVTSTEISFPNHK